MGSAKQTDKCVFRVCIKVMCQPNNTISIQLFEFQRAKKFKRELSFSLVSDNTHKCWTHEHCFWAFIIAPAAFWEFRAIPSLWHLTPWSTSPLSLAQDIIPHSELHLKRMDRASPQHESQGVQPIALREVQVETDHHRECERKKRSSTVISAHSMAQPKLFPYMACFISFYFFYSSQIAALPDKNKHKQMDINKWLLFHSSGNSWLMNFMDRLKYFCLNIHLNIRVIN